MSVITRFEDFWARITGAVSRGKNHVEAVAEAAHGELVRLETMVADTRADVARVEARLAAVEQALAGKSAATPAPAQLSPAPGASTQPAVPQPAAGAQAGASASA